MRSRLDSDRATKADFEKPGKQNQNAVTALIFRILKLLQF